MNYSIIIPTYNHCEDLLKPCIESIIKYTTLNKNIEIIVVANGCTDGTVDYLKSLDFEFFKSIIVPEKCGYTKAINKGIKQSTGDYVVLLNNDCVLLEQEKDTWLNRLVKPFLTNSRQGITGLSWGHFDIQEPYNKFLIFFCVMISNKVLNSIGLLDESFNPGGCEDADYCFRVQQDGYDVTNIAEPLGQDNDKKLIITDFPLYHKGEGTMHDAEHYEEWQQIFSNNIQKLKDKYKIKDQYLTKLKEINSSIYQSIVGGDEYAVGKNELLNKVVVDIGANEGTFSAYALSLGAKQILAVEPSPKTFQRLSNLFVGEECVNLFKNAISNESNKIVYLTDDTVCAHIDNTPNENEATTITLKDILDLIPIQEKIILKIDCEGPEHEVLRSLTREEIRRFEVIHIEIHEFDWMKKEYTRNSLAEFIISNGFKQTDLKRNYWWEPNEKGELIAVRELKADVYKFEKLSEEEIINKPKVYDCFSFFNELDLLEIRLNELNDVVDYFVISEGNQTHSGKDKEYIFEKNKDRYKKWESKIIYLKTDLTQINGSWAKENLQRNMLEKGLTKCKDNDIIILTDLDEIPSPEVLQKYDINLGLSSLEQRMYYYYFNNYISKWYCGKIFPYSYFKEGKKRLTNIRNEVVGSIENGGWHFSYLGGVDKVIEKIEAFAHQEYNIPQYKDKTHLKVVIDSGNDLYNRGLEGRIVNLDSTFPKYIVDHQKELQQYIKVENDVTVEISTKNRYFTTLPLAILSVINQTIKPKKIILFDDGDHLDLRNEPLYQNIFQTMNFYNIQWGVIYGERKGQVLNHEKAIQFAETQFIWRLDDDNYAEPDTLAKLLATIQSNNKIGAVASLVLHPGSIEHFGDSPEYVNRIEDIYHGINAQWGIHNEVLKRADHLYSTFLFRKEAALHGYCKELSSVGHREETIFTYEMKLNGWELYIRTDATTWHYRYNTGGIRENTTNDLWLQDEKVFECKMNQWGKGSFGKIIVMDNGIGDHYCLKHIIPELKVKYPKITLAVCYPEVFEDEGLNMISIARAADIVGNLGAYSIYEWMEKNNWKGSLLDAFKKYYL